MRLPTIPTILNECSDFLQASNNLPLLRNLSSQNDGFKKVKVRKKNTNEIFIQAFNQSFSTHKNIFQRSIFANGELSFAPSIDETLEPFYVFPINGYKFLYNPVVTNSLHQYKDDIQRMLNTVKNTEVAIDMFSSVIKQSYISENLSSGIKVGAEIIIYGIPYYYAIRKSLVDDYNRLS
jgi:hypothetical protein